MNTTNSDSSSNLSEQEKAREAERRAALEEKRIAELEELRERQLPIVATALRRRLFPVVRSLGWPKEPGLPLPRFNGLSDDTVVEQVDEARRKDKPNDEERATLRDFGRWRGKVVRYEARAEGGLLTLLRAASTFLAVGDEHMAYKLLNFAEEEYRFHAEAPPTDPAEQARIARKFTRRPDLMSDRLLMLGYKRPVSKRIPDPEQVTFSEVF